MIGWQAILYRKKCPQLIVDTFAWIYVRTIFLLKLEPALIQKFDLSPIFGLKSLDKLFDQPVRHPISPPHTISQPDYFIICRQGVVCVRMRGNFQKSQSERAEGAKCYFLCLIISDGKMF
jgi:hypothetical protein